MIKVNVDGAWKGNPLEVEVEAILEGLKLAASSGHRNVVLENDCKNVMDIIQKRNLKGLWKIIPIVEEIRRHACLFSSLHWKWIPRSANKAAHAGIQSLSLLSSG
ncbi:unnamed protein product [Malus baccata var. baccata]